MVWGSSFRRSLRNEGFAKVISFNIQGGAPVRQLSWFVTPISLWFMADITIVFMGVINQLITGGHHPLKMTNLQWWKLQSSNPDKYLAGSNCEHFPEGYISTTAFRPLWPVLAQSSRSAVEFCSSPDTSRCQKTSVTSTCSMGLLSPVKSIIYINIQPLCASFIAMINE